MLLRHVCYVSYSDVADFLFISGSFLKHKNSLATSREQLPNLITIQIFRIVITFITNEHDIIMVQCSMWILGNGIQNT